MMPFTYKGFLRGFWMCLPLALSVFTYGLVFGMLAQKVGMKTTEALVMSLTVFAGVSQIIVTDLWIQPLPIVAIILTTFIVNARHLLMGAALQPWFKSLNPLQAYGSLFFCTDENWALSMKEFQNGEKDAAFFWGGGFSVYLFWFLGSWLGFVSGLVIARPTAYGLDFAFVAVFIALLVSLFRGKEDVLPWFVAALSAIVASHFLPGKWYILIGALMGSGTVLFRHGNR